MKSSSIKLVLFASLLTLITQGCEGCKPPKPIGQKGEVRIIYTDATNTQMSGDDGVYDLGGHGVEWVRR